MVQSAAEFVAKLQQHTKLTPIEEQVLIAGGIRSNAALLGLTYAFPSIATALRLDYPKLSYAATKGLGRSHASFLAFAHEGYSQGVLPTLGYGAEPPPTSPTQIGSAVPLLPILPAAPAGPLAALPPQDVDRPQWLVRNQVPRGTCVAFAAVAIREYAEFLTGSPESIDLSEQFLYWAIKNEPGEPWPTKDGTILEFANRALIARGVCDCSLWPYSRTVIPGDPGQGIVGTAPSAAAETDALLRQTPAPGNYVDASHNPSRALGLYNLLKTRQQPVAITLPVFGDPATRQNTWTTLTAWQFGEIGDPLPSLTRIAGHAVAVCGFRPDPGEPTGGYFIVRNSWSTSWGSSADSAPAGQIASGRKGYGIISATYVDRYLDETLVI